MTKLGQKRKRELIPGPPPLTNSVENWLPLGGSDVGPEVLIHPFSRSAVVLSDEEGLLDAKVELWVCQFPVARVEDFRPFNRCIAGFHMLCEARM